MYNSINPDTDTMVVVNYLSNTKKTYYRLSLHLFVEESVYILFFKMLPVFSFLEKKQTFFHVWFSHLFFV